MTTLKTDISNKWKVKVIQRIGGRNSFIGKWKLNLTMVNISFAFLILKIFLTLYEMSFFQRDLTKEKLLAPFLDEKYAELNLNFERVNDLKLQKKGVDLIYNHNRKLFFIDEKAQLDYPNTELPTFTFELSYLKNGVEKTGWLLDENKITSHYFLVVGIHVIDVNDLEKGFTKAKIISVDRSKLLVFLDDIGLTLTKLTAYNRKLRSSEKKKNKTAIDELYMRTQGCLYYSNQLAEKPINLQLRLKFLLENNMAKIIYPIQ